MRLDPLNEGRKPVNDWIYNAIKQGGEVYILGLLHEVFGGAFCPPDVVRAFFTCLAPLRGPDANQLVTAGEDLEAVRARCRDGSLRSAIRCQETLLDWCRYSPQLPLLQDLIDITRLEQSFGYFCDNVHLYASNRECLVKEDTTIQNCLLMKNQNFYHRSTAENNRVEEVGKICSFFTETTRCIDQPVRYFCDKDLADVFVRFMSGLTPHVCSPYSSTQSTMSSGISPMLLGLTVTCLHRLISAG